MAALLTLAALAHFWLLPNLNQFKPTLEAALGQSMGRTVSLGKIGGGWYRWRLTLYVDQLTVAPPAASPAAAQTAPPHAKPLHFSRLELQPSLTSLLVLEPRFHRIALSGLAIDLRRDTSGQLSVNGLPMTNDQTDASLPNWLLRQNHITLGDTTLHWHDDLTGLAELTLSKGQLELSRNWFGHALTLTAQPPADWVSRFAFALHWKGDDVRHWADWRGKVVVDVGGVRLPAWAGYFKQAQLVPQGEGQTRIDLAFDGTRIVELNAQMALKNLLWRLRPEADAVRIPTLSGKLTLREMPRKLWQLTAEDLVAVSETGSLFDHSQASGEWQEGEQGHGTLTLSRLDLAALKPLLRHLPFDQNPAWKTLDPSGFVESIKLAWQGDVTAPRRYSVSGGFRQLGWRGGKVLPSVSGMSGTLHFSEAEGGLRLINRGEASVTLPSVFAQPLRFDQLDADVSWQRQVASKQVAVNLKQIRFANQDVNGQLAGRYTYTPDHIGVADLQATLGRASAARVFAYFPLFISAETRTWLAAALKSGTAKATQLTLKGDLEHFPFADDPTQGTFEVATQAEDVTLAYAPGWPALQHAQGKLRFVGKRMEITEGSGRLYGVRLHDVAVTLPDLGSAAPRLAVTGHANGQTADFLRFLQESPLDRLALDGLAADTAATGSGRLNLNLSIPLFTPEATEVKGRFTAEDNTLTFRPTALPALTAVRGTLDFTEQGASSSGIQLTALGGRSTLTLAPFRTGANQRPKLRFALNGTVDAPTALNQYAPLLSPYLTGPADYRAQFVLGQGLESLALDSPLTRTRLLAPAPLTKPEGTALPLQLTLTPAPAPSKRLAADAERGGFLLGVRLGTQAAAHLRLNPAGLPQRGHVRVEATSAGLGRGTAASLAPLPKTGLLLSAHTPRLDVDAWLALLSAAADRSQTAAAAALPVSVQLAAESAAAFGRQLSSVQAALQPTAEGWVMQLNSTEAEGTFTWHEAGAGHLQAHLSRLTFPLPSRQPAAPQTGIPAAALQRKSQLDLSVAQLGYQANGADVRDLGRLDVALRPQPDGWQITRLNLSNPDGTLAVSGQWLAQATPNVVTLQGELNSSNLDGVLTRMGYPRALQRGKGQIAGQVGWQGSLTQPDLSTLNGQLTLSAEDGQFEKINPSMGRLLSLLSLQALPRRLKLDFRDIFSEGFAFNTLEGKVKLDKGTLRTDDMEMSSAAARITLRGEVSLPDNRQRLRVRVEPHLSESLAIVTGAALLHPITGLITYAAQKLLQNPFGKIFAYDYDISGSLSDPVIRKVGRVVTEAVAPPPTPPASTHPTNGRPAAAAGLAPAPAAAAVPVAPSPAAPLESP